MRTPMLFMHGTADRVVPHTMSDQLYEAAHNVTPGLKRLVKIEGASHSGAFRSGAQYETAVGASCATPRGPTVASKARGARRLHPPAARAGYAAGKPGCSGLSG